MSRRRRADPGVLHRSCIVVSWLTTRTLRLTCRHVCGVLVCRDPGAEDYLTNHRVRVAVVGTIIVVSMSIAGVSMHHRFATTRELPSVFAPHRRASVRLPTRPRGRLIGALLAPCFVGVPARPTARFWPGMKALRSLARGSGATARTTHNTVTFSARIIHARRAPQGRSTKRTQH